MVPRGIHSHLGYTSLLGWADGTLSCVAMAHLCKPGQRDGLQIPMLDKLANLANSEVDNNIVSNFKREILTKGGVYTRITQVDGPYFKHCILPSTIFKFIAQFPQQFKLRLGGVAEACTTFWRGLFSSVDGMKFKDLHPHLRGKTLAQLAHCIPLRVHEDAGPFTKTSSMNVVGWSSMLGRGMLAAGYSYGACLSAASPGEGTASCISPFSPGK